MKTNRTLLLLGVGFATSCANPQKSDQNTLAEHPNILWITCEDISPNLASFGDSVAKTPVLDGLAKEGVRYTHAFSCAGVCAPSRSSIITGMYPPSIGTQNMRTGKDVMGISKGIYKKETGLVDLEGNTVPQYSAVIPPEVKCFTEYLRKAGYYCTNNAKTDYQFAAPISAWNENDTKAHWRNRPKGRPFFSVFNFNVTHESKIWKKKHDPLLVDPMSPKIPPYFPEDSIVRQDVARKYSNITELDGQVAALLNQLKEDGLYDKTIIFFFSDHGGPLPRGKREIYDSGLHVPFIVRFPNQKNAGTVCNDMISFVDLAPTMLSLAGIKPPEYMEGQPFLGKYKAKEPRKEIFGARDRMDECYDMVRCVRTKNYLYVKNFHPELPNYQDIKYRKQMDMMNELLKLHQYGKLDAKQEIWFHQTKPVEELYDVRKDPYQLNNIADDPANAKVLKDLRKRLEEWQFDIHDMGFIPEGEMVRQMWPGLEQPVTMTPEIHEIGQTYKIDCATKGASMVYQISDNGQSKPEWKYWKVYQKPVSLKSGQTLHAVAIRVGFRQSREARVTEDQKSNNPIE